MQSFILTSIIVPVIVVWKLFGRFTWIHMRKNTPGFSMMELVIALAIIGIFFTSVTLVFYKLGKSILINRTRTVATNLAQEKIEALKNLSYTRLRATSLTDLLTYNYDNTFYAPEAGILVGDIPYRREVLIQRVQEDASGALVEVLPDAGDTGIKKITATVRWTEEGAAKSFSLSNLFNDPNRKPLDGTISGVARDDVGALLAGVRIAVVDNLNWNAMTDVTGSYSIKLPTGTYEVTASKDGYWPRESGSLNAAPGVSWNPTLKQMATGTATGYVYLNDHLVISKVCASTETTAGVDCEWVELYNPTTSSWVIDNTFYLAEYNDSGSSCWFNSNYFDSHPWTHKLNIVTATIEPYHYYLIANTTTVTMGDYTVNADAYYVCTEPAAHVEADKRGSIFMGIMDTVTWTWKKNDILGWAPSTAIALIHEGLALKDSNGLDKGKTHIRYSRADSYFSPNQGNAYDSESNNNDFISNLVLSTSVNYYPKNSSSTAVSPVSGTPAYGATITCDDGLSNFTNSYYVLNPQNHAVAYFQLTSIATGTWTISAFYQTGAAYSEIGNVAITNNNEIVAIPNAATTPAWPANDVNNILLSSQATFGYIAGSVKNGVTGISGIKVEAGISNTYTNASGHYFLQLDPNLLYNITANPGNLNANYTEQIQSAGPLNAGQILNGINFDISPGGSLAGRVISNSGDTLPDVLVAAYDSGGNEVSSALTGTDGVYHIDNLSTGGNNYVVRPALDASETSTPAQRTFTVIAGQEKWTDTAGVYSTFTVTSAMGKCIGTVSFGTTPINTGVLIMACTSTIAAEPPVIDDTLRNGGLLYYGTVSQSDGSYELEVRGGLSYNIYAWYSAMDSAGAVTVHKKSELNHLINAGSSAVVTFTFP